MSQHISYLFKGATHTDYSDEYMTQLNMDDEQKEFTLNMQIAQLEQIAITQRGVRDGKLAEARALIERHRDELALGITTTLSASETELLTHIQALRDVPQQGGFPLNIKWPSLPQI